MTQRNVTGAENYMRITMGAKYKKEDPVTTNLHFYVIGTRRVEYMTFAPNVWSL